MSKKKIMYKRINWELACFNAFQDEDERKGIVLRTREKNANGFLELIDIILYENRVKSLHRVIEVSYFIDGVKIMFLRIGEFYPTKE